MHLGGADVKRLDGIAGFLKDLDIEQIICCHCTGTDAYQHLRSKLGERVALGQTGMNWVI